MISASYNENINVTYRKVYDYFVKCMDICNKYQNNSKDNRLVICNLFDLLCYIRYTCEVSALPQPNHTKQIVNFFS